MDLPDVLVFADAEIWPRSPDTFDPMRFIENPNAPVFTFGIGYRACAGIPYANRLLYLFFVRLISAFEIGQVGEMEMDPLAGGADAKNLVNYMKAYKVLFKPRKVTLSGEAGGGGEGFQKDCPELGDGK
jgi:3-hydroxyphenylacetate 6-hydroxylase